MNGASEEALIERAVTTYPAMMMALLSAMRTYHRNDEPARNGTTLAALPLSVACVLAVRMADNRDALDLAEALFAVAIAEQRWELLQSDGSERAAAVLRMLEEKGAI